MGRPTFLFALCLGARSLSILLGNGPSYVQWLVLARLYVRWVDTGGRGQAIAHTKARFSRKDVDGGNVFDIRDLGVVWLCVSGNSPISCF